MWYDLEMTRITVASWWGQSQVRKGENSHTSHVVTTQWGQRWWWWEQGGDYRVVSQIRASWDTSQFNARGPLGIVWCGSPAWVKILAARFVDTKCERERGVWRMACSLGPEQLVSWGYHQLRWIRQWRSRLRGGSSSRNSVVDTLSLRCLLDIQWATGYVSLETMGGVQSYYFRNH